MSICINCGAVAEGDTWEPGQVCLFGMLFACSVTCARAWAAANAAPGYRPGEPGYDEDVEPEEGLASDAAPA